MFQVFHSIPGFHQNINFALVSNGLTKRIHLLCNLDDCLIIAESVPFLLEYRKLLLHPCQNLGIVINLEELDCQLTNRVQHLGMLIDAI